jgi:hypothetical protein
LANGPIAKPVADFNRRVVTHAGRTENHLKKNRFQYENLPIKDGFNFFRVL